ncbi:MAG: haloacid dehalogenase-like hydrolase [Candidatus Methylacidiphilales bacterium]
MIPLCVDLDGTLIRGDTLWLSLRAVMAQGIRPTLHIPWTFLTGGRAQLKDWLTTRYLPDPAQLPYHLEVVSWLCKEKEEGRRLILVTGAHRILADGVALHTGIFHEVIATSNGYNMSGLLKARELVRRFGENGYDYAGNSYVDIPVWQCARNIIIVNASRRVATEARQIGQVEKEFSRPLATGSFRAATDHVDPQ